MGWQERRYRDPGEEGGFRRGLRRIFVEGDNFFSWAVPFITVAGIRVKIHLIYVVFIVGDLLFAIPEGGLGLSFRAIMHASLFLLVLLHEFGHCIACRWVGGEADEVLMWPLGGLAYCRPPHNWKADLITTIGGPAVNVLLLPVTAGLMMLAGASFSDLIFNPFDPSAAIAGLGWGTFWKLIVFYLYFDNAMLLVFNVVLVMFPLDGARMLRATLWSRIGYRRATSFAINLGLALAVVVGVFAISGGSATGRLLAVALFCGMTCYYERQRLRLYDDEADAPWRGGMGEAGGLSGMQAESLASDRRRFREAAQKQAIDRKLQAEEDRVLSKIQSQGMDSLTRADKRILKQATDRRRKAGDGA